MYKLIFLGTVFVELSGSRGQGDAWTWVQLEGVDVGRSGAGVEAADWTSSLPEL